MNLEQCHIRISVTDGASFMFGPGTRQWDEAINLLRGYYPDEDIADPCISVCEDIEHSNDLSRDVDHE